MDLKLGKFHFESEKVLALSSNQSISIVSLKLWFQIFKQLCKISSLFLKPFFFNWIKVSIWWIKVSSCDHENKTMDNHFCLFSSFSHFTSFFRIIKLVDFVVKVSLLLKELKSSVQWSPEVLKDKIQLILILITSP